MSTMYPMDGPGAPKKRPVRTLLIAGGLALAVSGAGAAAVFAANDNTATPSPSPSASAGPHKNGMRGPGMDARNALHGEFVVNRKGSYVTVLMQRGTVDAVSGTSITVKSKDGFSQTYTINADTKIRKFNSSTNNQGNKQGTASASDLKTGDEVRIVGDKSGDTVTASNIVDGVMPAFGPGNGHSGGKHMNGGQPSQSPAPSQSPSASSSTS